MNNNNKKTIFRHVKLFSAFFIAISFFLFSFYGMENANAALPSLPATEAWVNIRVCTDMDSSNNVAFPNPYEPVLRWTPSGNAQTWYWVLVDDDGDWSSPAVSVSNELADTSHPLSLGTIDLDKPNYNYAVAIGGSLGWTPWATGSFVIDNRDGTCGTNLEFCTGTTLTQATPGLCAYGVPTSISGNPAGPWTWNCEGTGGGIDANNCSAEIKVPVTNCATPFSPCSYEDLFPTTPNLCKSGALPSSNPVEGTDEWTWSCYDTCNNPQSCSVPITPTITPRCGTDNGKAFCGTGLRPTNLCDPGYSSILPPSVGIYEDWEWNCTGTCPDTSVECSAGGQRSCGWIETQP